MNKINEQIKKIHEQMKKRGEWDGLPPELCVYGCQYRGKFENCTCDAHDKHSEPRNAYIAQILDEITYNIVMAMKARREELMLRNWKPKHNSVYTENLALALIRTMDLMGFYGVGGSMSTLKNNVLNYKPDKLLRGIIFKTSRASLNLNGNSIAKPLKATALRILRIAELDKIDLQWHVDARFRWESE